MAPTLSQIRAWDSDHLNGAAWWWDSRAQTWQSSFRTVATEITAPGGTPWEGQAADAAAARAAADHAAAAQAATLLHQAAAVARQGAEQIAAAKSSALQAIDAAVADLFSVGEDLSVTDVTRPRGMLAHAMRQQLATEHAAAIATAAEALAEADAAVAGQVRAALAAMTAVGFPSGAVQSAPGGDPAPPPSPAATPDAQQAPPADSPPLDAGAQQRDGVTDVNDPGVSWQDGFDPGQWKNSWHNPLITDNPPGDTGGPGPERDAAWQNYLDTPGL